LIIFSQSAAIALCLTPDQNGEITRCSNIGWPGFRLPGWRIIGNPEAILG
jgi:hypothetical protein